MHFETSNSAGLFICGDFDMGYKPNEVEKSVNEHLWLTKQHESKSRGKRRSQSAIERLPEQTKQFAEQEELDIHANWMISCAIEGITDMDAERLYLEATESGAWELLEWYFNPIPGAEDRIRIALSNGENDANYKAEYSDFIASLGDRFFNS